MSNINRLMHINGEWTPSVGGETFEVVNPATEEVIGRVPRGNSQDIDRAVAAARAAFEPWRQTKPKVRARMLYDLARALEARVEEFTALEVSDQGKIIVRARGDVLSTVRFLEFYAGAADKIMGETMHTGPDKMNFTVREPLGVTAHIIPWNYPLNLLGRSLAPALAAGNTAVVKPAEQTPLTALRLAELMQELGFPPGVFNVVTGYGEEAGVPLSRHPGIDGITFTGSGEVGRLVMQAAAEHIKPVVLELGGKSPHIIFADADLDVAAFEVARALFNNAGQVCSAGSRLLVQDSIKEPLLERLKQRAGQIRIGPGMDAPDMGPLVSQEQYARVMDYIDIGQQEGARLVTGGTRPPHLPRGYFVTPTIFDEVQPAMRIAQEEIFGPVLSVLTFQDEDEALEIANNVKYGLVAGIFTNDINRAFRLVNGLQAGQIYVNEWFSTGEEMPMGGYKQSGFGREKGLEALRGYTQVKSVSIRLR